MEKHTYMIIDLRIQIGELDELSWGWANAQLTGKFRQRNLFALVHDQVGSSRLSTTSSSGSIQQLLREIDYSSSWRGLPSYRGTVVKDISIRFLLYRGKKFCMPLLFLSEYPHHPLHGRRASQHEYQAGYQQWSLSGGRLFAWANSIEEDTYVLGYWATISSACCFHHFQRGTITLVHII